MPAWAAMLERAAELFSTMFTTWPTFCTSRPLEVPRMISMYSTSSAAMRASCSRASLTLPARRLPSIRIWAVPPSPRSCLLKLENPPRLVSSTRSMPGIRDSMSSTDTGLYWLKNAEE